MNGDGPLLRYMIGRVLRRRRLAQSRTLREVAAAAGVSLPYLSEVERGRKEVSSEILASICRALGLSLADLLAEVHAELVRAQPRATAATAATHRDVRMVTSRSGHRVRLSGQAPGSTVVLSTRRAYQLTLASGLVGDLATPAGGLAAVSELVSEPVLAGSAQGRSACGRNAGYQPVERRMLAALPG
jgi:transcriptional regulator with XRE-family HTH domain